MKVIWFIVCTLVLATILLPLLPEQTRTTEQTAATTADGDADSAAVAGTDNADEKTSAARGDDDAASTAAENGDQPDTATESATDNQTDRSELEQALAAATGSAIDNTNNNAGAESADNTTTDAGAAGAGNAAALSSETNAATAANDTAADANEEQGSGKLNAMEIDRSDPLAIPDGIPGVNAPLPTSPDEFPEGYDPLIHTPEFMEALKKMQEMAGESRGDASSIAGSGTKEDPYRITWDLLLQAAQTYKPREDKREIPDAISKLNGKYVRISGYMLIPIGAVEFDEALLLMNMWDGCCIGLPPTAYDAIEVMLGKSQKYETNRVLSFGTVEGVLKVDPYEVSNWLVGLYIIENAKVTEMM